MVLAGDTTVGSHQSGTSALKRKKNLPRCCRCGDAGAARAAEGDVEGLGRAV
jgi:hypothetical protein